MKYMKGMKGDNIGRTVTVYFFFMAFMIFMVSHSLIFDGTLPLRRSGCIGCR